MHSEEEDETHGDTGHTCICSGVGRTIVKRTVWQRVVLPANSFGVLGRTEEACMFG